MSDLRSRVPAQALMQRTLELHPDGAALPSGDAFSWFKGALGEIAVAGILAELGPEWTVLHSVPIGRGDSDIDHVVIGPPGVFTINTKNHAGQDVWMAGHGLLVSGQKTNYVGLAAAEAFRAEVALSEASGLTVPVTPLLVLVEPGKRTMPADLEHGVRVLADAELLGLLRSGRREFSDEQVQRIADAAADPVTWRGVPLPDADPRLVSARFNAILARSLQASMASSREGAARSMNRSPVGSSTPAARRPAAGYGSQVVAASRRTRSKPRRSARRRSIYQLASAGLLLFFMYGVVLPAYQAFLAR